MEDKKQKNLSDHKLDHDWWSGHPARELLVCWVLQQSLLVVRQSDGLRCGTPPGHIRVYRVHQGRAATTLIALVVGYDGANYRAGQ